jgi:hypothetical protein
MLGDLNRKFEHALHCHEVCSLTLDKRSKAATPKCVSSATREGIMTTQLLMGDEIWIYGYDPETKQESSQ